jgi:hypothetical protein
MMWRDRYVRVHLKNNEPSIEGLLHKRPNGFFRLLAAQIVADRGVSYQADGEVIIPAENVLFFQEVEKR